MQRPAIGADERRWVVIVKEARRDVEEREVSPELLTSSNDHTAARSSDDPTASAVAGGDRPDLDDEASADDVGDADVDGDVDPDELRALLEGQYPSFDRLRDARSRIAQERAIAAVRNAQHDRAPRSSMSRRTMAVAAVVAVCALVAGIKLASSSGSSVEVTATTPAQDLPWRTYTSPSGNFRVELPGTPLLTPVGSDPDGIAQRFTLTLPGAEIRIDVDAAQSGSGVVLQAAAEARAAQDGLLVQDALATRVPWGNALDATMGNPSPVGLVRVTSTKTYQFTVSVTSDFVSARTSSIFERVATSFRAIDTH